MEYSSTRPGRSENPLPDLQPAGCTSIGLDSCLATSSNCLRRRISRVAVRSRAWYISNVRPTASVGRQGDKLSDRAQHIMAVARKSATEAAKVLRLSRLSRCDRVRRGRRLHTLRSVCFALLGSKTVQLSQSSVTRRAHAWPRTSAALHVGGSTSIDRLPRRCLVGSLACVWGFSCRGQVGLLSLQAQSLSSKFAGPLRGVTKA